MYSKRRFGRTDEDIGDRTLAGYLLQVFLDLCSITSLVEPAKTDRFHKMSVQKNDNKKK